MKPLRASFFASLPRERLHLNSFSFVSLASVSDEEDEFAELGPLVVKSSNVAPKLMSEKLDCINVANSKKCGSDRKSPLLEYGCSSKSDAKLDSSRKLLNFKQEIVDSSKFEHVFRSVVETLRSAKPDSSWKPLNFEYENLDSPKFGHGLGGVGLPESSSSAMVLGSPQIFKSIESSHPNVKSENLNSTESDVEYGEVPEMITSCSVTVYNVPSAIKLSQLKDAISVFGKVSNAIVREVPNALACCDIQFECAESRDRAVSVGRIMVENFSLPVRSADIPKIAAVTVCNIRPETTASSGNTIGTSDASVKFLLKPGSAANANCKSETESISQKLYSKLSINSSQMGTTESVERTSGSVPVVEDEFEELGSPIKKNSDVISKLMTKKEHLSIKSWNATRKFPPSDIKWRKSFSKR